MVKFEKKRIDTCTFEAAAAFDVNNDGYLDIVCGENWYEGPDFKKKHKMCDVLPEGEYFDDFSDYPMDVNGNGYMDIITGGWWGKTLRWRENPGAAGGEWKIHDIDECGCIETTRFYDVDNCGREEIFPNTPGEPQAFYKLDVDKDGKGKGTFTKYVISEGGSGHGMGVGDIDGDGKMEVILQKGILHMPEGGPCAGLWTYTEEYDFTWGTGVPILVHDVNKDGLADIIVGNGHGYGLWWYEQGKDENGKRTWTEHTIDMAWAQYHDIQLCDIDGDGELELVTGKRYRAHCGNDPGDNDPVFVCYYKITDGRFSRYVIDFGEADGGAGAGIYLWLADLNGNGKPDIVVPGKTGLYLFTNLG